MAVTHSNEFVTRLRLVPQNHPYARSLNNILFLLIFQSHQSLLLLLLLLILDELFEDMFSTDNPTRKFLTNRIAAFFKFGPIKLIYSEKTPSRVKKQPAE
jgi:hypothetical protein